MLIVGVHQVEGFGGLLHVAEQFLARDAGQSLGAALAEAVPQVAVGQLHDDDELAVDRCRSVRARGCRGGGSRWTRLRALSSCSAGRLSSSRRVEVAEDELHRLEQPARRLDLPDLAETAAAQALDQPIPAKRVR